MLGEVSQAGGECLLGPWREGKTGIDLNLVWSLCQMISPSLPPRSTGRRSSSPIVYGSTTPFVRVSERGRGEGTLLHTGHKNSQEGARERERENWSGKLLVSGHGRLQDLLSSFLYSSSFSLSSRERCMQEAQSGGDAGRGILKRRDGNSVFRVSWNERNQLKWTNWWRRCSKRVPF